jgi:hypothetical protein
MNLKKSVAILMLVVPAISCAQSSPRPLASGARKLLSTALCDLTAEKAASVIQATMKAKKFDARPEVISQTSQGSAERSVLLEIFATDSIITSVLLHSAAFGAGMMPTGIADESRKDIEKFAFLYVRNACALESIHMLQ